MVDARVPAGVGPPEWPIHPDAILWHVVDPVVGYHRALLLALHHLHDRAVGLDVRGVEDLVEHDLRGVADPDGGGGSGLVHRVVGEPVRSAIHHDGSHQALLVRTGPVDVVEVGVVDAVVLGAGRPPMGLEGGPVGVQEVAVVDQAAYAVVNPRNVAVVHVFARMAQ